MALLIVYLLHKLSLFVATTQPIFKHQGLVDICGCYHANNYLTLTAIQNNPISKLSAKPKEAQVVK